VRAVCEQASVPLEIVSLQKEYWSRVVNYTIAEIKAGRTPNPDILCNQQIKFGAFYDAIDRSFTKIATGHYAQLSSAGDQVLLKKSPDPIKDQTYFLSHMSQLQLQRALFPIGHLTKAEVRAVAHAYDLPTKNRKDSQGICFLGKLKFAEFVKHHVGVKPGGLIEFETGKKMGSHEGFWFYTIGQRQGLGLAGGPWYVVAKNVEENIVFISRSYYAPDKARDTFFIQSCNWIAGSSPMNFDNLQVKMRHGPKTSACSLSVVGSDQYQVKLQERDQGIAPGQFAAFYDGEICLGSARIQEMGSLLTD
jgi:tRNA-specific 2-thiouridylase